MNLPYLEEQEKQELEGEISIDEVWQALNGFQNHKTPGDDGFTKEFYEAFFDLLGTATKAMWIGSAKNNETNL